MLTDKRKSELRGLFKPFGKTKIIPWDYWEIRYCKYPDTPAGRRSLQEKTLIFDELFARHIECYPNKNSHDESPDNPMWEYRSYPILVVENFRPRTKDEVAFVSEMRHRLQARREEALRKAVERGKVVEAVLKDKRRELDQVKQDVAAEGARLVSAIVESQGKLGPRLLSVFFLNHDGVVQQEIANKLGVSVGTVNADLKKLKDIGFRVTKRKGSAAPHLGGEYRHNHSRRGVAYDTENVVDQNIDIYERVDEDEWKDDIWAEN